MACVPRFTAAFVLLLNGAQACSRRRRRRRTRSPAASRIFPRLRRAWSHSPSRATSCSPQTPTRTQVCLHTSSVKAPGCPFSPAWPPPLEGMRGCTAARCAACCRRPSCCMFCRPGETSRLHTASPKPEPSVDLLACAEAAGVQVYRCHIISRHSVYFWASHCRGGLVPRLRSVPGCGSRARGGRRRHAAGSAGDICGAQPSR